MPPTPNAQVSPPANTAPIIPPVVAVPTVLPSPPPLPADPHLTPAQVAAEAARFKRSLAAEVPQLVHLAPDTEHRLISLARAQVAATDTEILRPQLVVVVDRAAASQLLAIMLARPEGAWEVLGAVHVSTGQAGRFDHYVTPTGVYRHGDAILDYRAQGTYNENHIRGLGLKGMRVWDFGWQWAHKGWDPGAGKPQETQIRMEMHATDPAVLEQRIGRTASQGCIRIPSSMNHFMDQHGVLDTTYEKLAADEIRFRALLLPGRTPTPLAGDALVIVDSSEKPGTPPDQRADRLPSAGSRSVQASAGKGG